MEAKQVVEERGKNTGVITQSVHIQVHGDQKANQVENDQKVHDDKTSNPLMELISAGLQRVETINLVHGETIGGGHKFQGTLIEREENEKEAAKKAGDYYQKILLSAVAETTEEEHKEKHAVNYAHKPKKADIDHVPCPPSGKRDSKSNLIWPASDIVVQNLEIQSAKKNADDEGHGMERKTNRITALSSAEASRLLVEAQESSSSFSAGSMPNPLTADGKPKEEEEPAQQNLVPVTKPNKIMVQIKSFVGDMGKKLSVKVDMIEKKTKEICKSISNGAMEVPAKLHQILWCPLRILPQKAKNEEKMRKIFVDALFHSIAAQNQEMESPAHLPQLWALKERNVKARAALFQSIDIGLMKLGPIQLRLLMDLAQTLSNEEQVLDFGNVKTDDLFRILSTAFANSNVGEFLVKEINRKEQTIFGSIDSRLDEGFDGRVCEFIAEISGEFLQNIKKDPKYNFNAHQTETIEQLIFNCALLGLHICTIKKYEDLKKRFPNLVSQVLLFGEKKGIQD